MLLRSTANFIWRVLIPVLGMVCVIVYLCSLIGIGGAGQDKPMPVAPDTVHTKRHYAPPKVVPMQPTRVIEYMRPDTGLRDSLEKDTLITGVVIGHHQIRIETITPLGQVHAAIFEIPPDYQTITVNSDGQAEVKRVKKRKRLKRIAVIGAVAGAGIGLFLLLK